MIEIEVGDAAWTAALPGAPDIAREAAQAAAALSPGREIAILLADARTVADLNQRFLGKAGPTNVLSFPAPATAEGRLGDIALAFEVCAAEAAAQGKPFADHLRHLVVHGVLHLIGYDHQTDRDAERMEMIESDLLAAMGVADPYAAEA